MVLLLGEYYKFCMIALLTWCGLLLIPWYRQADWLVAFLWALPDSEALPWPYLLAEVPSCDLLFDDVYF